MKKYILTSISFLALMASSSPGYAGTCTGLCLTSTVGTEAQLTADYNQALAVAKASGLVPPSGWGSIEYALANPDSSILDGSPAAFTPSQNNEGGTITASVAMTGATNGVALAVFYHEIGHAMDQNDNIALEGDNPTIADSLAMENAANLYGAIFSGDAALQQGQTFQSGIQAFINDYLGNAAPGGDLYHGSLALQLTTITESFPDYSFTVPSSVVEEMEQIGELPAADLTPGATFTMQGNKITMQGSTASDQTVNESDNGASPSTGDDSIGDDSSGDDGDDYGYYALDYSGGPTSVDFGMGGGSGIQKPIMHRQPK